MATPGTTLRPYRDFLTPALHARFTDASAYTLGLCYLIALWMGEWDDYLWAWFPIGPAGIRTLLLFIPSLLIYVLRVAQWHTGQRNTASPYQTFLKYTFRKATFVTIAFYAVSAWLYGEIYIYSRTPKSRLTYTEAGKLYDRIKLNERPVYLRCLFIVLAIVQGICHLWKDYDRIQVPLMRPKKEHTNEISATSPRKPSGEPRQMLLQKSRAMVITAIKIAAASFGIGTLVYFLGLRQIIWAWHYWFAKHLIALGKASKPTGLPPFMGLLLMFGSQGALLTLLWQFTNTAFDLYIAKEPLKKGKPITSDSKDPNGSLLNGLKSKKMDVKAIAFWELALITDSFVDRRKTIYGELERQKAPTFQQVTDICLHEIKAINLRISKAMDPQYQPEDKDGKKKPSAPIALVPQISQPIRDGQIAGPGTPPQGRMQMIESVTSQIARAHSSPQNAQNAQARKYLKQSQEKFNQSVQEGQSLWSTYSNKFACSPLGWPFRACICRTANVVVNGAPYSRQSSMLAAITTLSNLTVFSIKEDEYGQFNKGVPEMVRVFTATIKKIEEYVASLQVHWTDLDCLARPEAERKKIPEVEVVVDALKEGLERIVGAFNEYLGPMGMSRAEIQEAKNLMARTRAPEIEKIKR